MIEFKHELDARNESCPLPVLRTKRMLGSMPAGEILHVIATDPASVEDINILLEALHHELIESRRVGAEYHFYIKKIAK